MKNRLRNLLKWFMRKPLGMRIGSFVADVQRSVLAQRIKAKLIQTVFKDQKVLNGPFQGMYFPYPYWAKLIGSYEEELHPAISEIIQTPYAQIINVGSAEGYFSVGLAFKMKSTEIFSFDINSYSLDLCRKHGEANHVADRMRFESFCDVERLNKFDFSKPSLIFCDCEGYEGTLLDPSKVPGLKDCDILVEVHDFIIPGLMDKISSRFQATHSITKIREQLRNPSKYPQLDGLSIFEQRVILDEDRPSAIGLLDSEWLFLKSKARRKL